ncbi:AraC family transcriptional regulator [Lacticaseibacillus kribbianus]|uniref:AraC family transcriptional regulator n=1 Tax=Lacticaseibacillus kribbianus TaxID=2926292 RepID=UPI001CD67165|nr:AraC family transcriptional regulator [Lacticaseibacillus kribbianus]
MAQLKMTLNTPATYLQSGEFTAALGWRHHRATHGADTELLLGVTGEVHLSVAGQTFHLGPGDALTVFPHETIVGAQPTLTPSRFLWLHVVAPATAVAGTGGTALAVGLGPGGTAGADIGTAPAATPTGPGAPAVALLPRFAHLGQFPQPGVAWRQLLDVAHDPASGQLLCDYQATLVVLRLAAAAEAADRRPDGTRLVNPVRAWLRINLAARPSVATVAAQFERNPDYLNRLFKQATGQTIGQYGTGLRLDYAKLLLLSTDDPVATVAARAFFPDEKYFARVFHRAVGLPPSRYRAAFTHTFMNNDQVDPGVNLQAQVRALETTKEH